MSDNGTYQRQRCGQLATAAVAYVSQAVDTTGGKHATDCAAGFKTLAEEADKMLRVMTNLAGVSREKFLNSREFPLPQYRAIIYKRLHERGLSTIRIGQLFGKNHATVLHGIKYLDDLLEVSDKEIVELTIRFEEQMKQPKIMTMSKLFFTEISYSGGMRKVESDIWPTMTETFRHSIVAEEQLEMLKANLEELVEKRAAELKVKPVPVTLSPAWDRLKDATLPRFLSVGRITVTLTEVRHVIGKDKDEEADV